jgi:hypothetical protein
LKHIKAYLEDNHPTGNTETIGRDTEELEKKLPGKDKYHQCNKRHNSSTTYDRLTFFIRHTMSHGKKDRHRSQRVGQREE